MLTFEKAKKGVRYPQLVVREVNRQYFRTTSSSGFNDRGIDVIDKDWDNLIILDACRYDMLAEAELGGETASVYSKGSKTEEFLAANFDGRDLTDTVYITANPMLYRHSDEIKPDFHAIHNVWLDDGWSEEHNTVLPETIAEETIELSQKYDDKRIISHFIQPHYPFIDSGTEFDKGQLEDPNDDVSFWKKKLMGELLDVSDELIWKMYNANLDRAIPHVEELITELVGKTVVTSDHGNMVGESSWPIPLKEYGHPASLYTIELTKVPWIEFNSSERKQVSKQSGDTRSEEPVEESSVNERLESLGYK